MSQRILPPLAPLVLVLGLIQFSCGTGGLEQLELTGECGGELACGTSVDDGPLAVGATIEVRAASSTAGTGLPAITMIAADENVLDVEGDRVSGLSPGLSAILVTDDNGVVIDFFHIFVELPDHLQLTRVEGGADLDGVLELFVGDELLLTTRPALAGQLLAGAAPSQWSSESPAITILGEGDPTRRRLVAREVGTAEIHIESMGLSRTLIIEVLP